jgi:hypothetical protein
MSGDPCPLDSASIPAVEIVLFYNIHNLAVTYIVKIAKRRNKTAIV